MFIDINRRTTDELYERADKASELMYGRKNPKNVVDIYKKTGVFNFNDTIKIEIPDNKMEFSRHISKFIPRDNKESKIPLREFITHDLLYSNVHYLDETNVVIHKGECPGSPTTLGYNDYDKGDIHIFRVSDYKNGDILPLYQTAAHEIQHAVQRACGWDLGGSPEMFNPSDEHLEEYRKIIKTLSSDHGFYQLEDHYRNFLEKYPGVVNPLHLYNNATPIQTKVLNMAMDIVSSSTHQDHEYRYKCLFGEIEAEATAKKIFMTLDGRKDNHPYFPFTSLIKDGIHRRRDHKTNLLYIVSSSMIKGLHMNFVKDEHENTKKLREAYEI